MSTHRIYPHRTASSESAQVRWWLERAGERFVLPDVIQGWDYDSPLTVGMTLSIDEGEVLARTGLPTLSSLMAVLQVECRSAQKRFSTAIPFGGSSGEEVEAEVTMPPGSVAGSFAMSAHVVLGQNHGYTTGGGRVATRPGSRLLSLSSHTVLLEGDAGRFPAEAVSFAALGLREAPWTLSLSHDDMGDSFMGAVRLLINTDHPVGEKSLNGEDPERFAAAMTADLIRLLVAGLRNDRVEPEHKEIEDSLASVMDSMCDTYLKCSFEEARSLYMGDPIGFEALVQQEINPMQGFIS